MVLQLSERLMPKINEGLAELTGSIDSAGGDWIRNSVALTRNLVVSSFEWFGELGLFCVRLFRAAITPPY
jgi:hypothetical protein